MPNCSVEQQAVNSLQAQIDQFELAAKNVPPKSRGQLLAQAANLKFLHSIAKRTLDECIASHTVSQVNVQVFCMANDNGSSQTAVTPAQMGVWVQKANQIFAPTRTRLLFDQANDFQVIKNTRLNELLVDTGLQVDADALVDAAVLADTVPARIAIICRKSRTLASPGPFGCGVNCGFSWYPGKYIFMPEFNNTDHLLAHELGHYLGLPHTHQYDIDTTRDADLLFQALGDDLQKLDNDASLVNDTPPEMLIQDQVGTSNLSVVFRTKVISFLRNNVMSYYPKLPGTEKQLTPSQIARVRQVVQERRAAGLTVTDVMVP